MVAEIMSAEPLRVEAGEDHPQPHSCNHRNKKRRPVSDGGKDRPQQAAGCDAWQ